MTRLLLIASLSVAVASWDLSALRSVGETLGLSNLDVDDEMFGAGAGDPLEAELFEDGVTTDSRRLSQTVGGARDKKGCLTSAGYSWCAAKESCIRFFEEDCLADESAALETDEFGCSTAAGFVFCAAKGKCLRPFEEACQDEAAAAGGAGSGSFMHDVVATSPVYFGTGSGSSVPSSNNEDFASDGASMVEAQEQEKEAVAQEEEVETDPEIGSINSPAVLMPFTAWPVPMQSSRFGFGSFPTSRFMQVPTTNRNTINTMSARPFALGPISAGGPGRFGTFSNSNRARFSAFRPARSPPLVSPPVSAASRSYSPAMGNSIYGRVVQPRYWPYGR